MMVKLMQELGITPDFDGALPHGVSAASRTDGESVFVFLQNFNNAPVTVSTAEKWVTAEKNTPVTGDIALAPFETVILEKQK